MSQTIKAKISDECPNCLTVTFIGNAKPQTTTHIKLNKSQSYIQSIITAAQDVAQNVETLDLSPKSGEYGSDPTIQQILAPFNANSIAADIIYSLVFENKEFRAKQTPEDLKKLEAAAALSDPSFGTEQTLPTSQLLAAEPLAA